jgi:hypothetical protein
MLFGLLTKTRRPSSTPSRRAAYRPQLEALEDRRLLSSGWVIGNGGSGSFDQFPTLSQPDAAGNLYVTGYLSGSATFGATTLSGGSTSCSFVAKMDSNGNFLWAEQFGGAPKGGFAHRGVALDGNGNVFLAGTFSGTQTFGSTTLTSGSTNGDDYLCKLDGNGNFLWAYQAGNTNVTSAQVGVAVDAGGNAYLAWDTKVNNGWCVLHLTEVDGNGHLVWSKQVLSNATSVSVSGGIALDPGGNIYLSGLAEGIQPNDYGFVAKFDAAGNVLWTQFTTGEQFAMTASEDPVTGATVVYDHFSSTLEKRDGSTGSLLWSDSLGVGGDPRALATDAAGNVYAAGIFQNYTPPFNDFDPGPGTASFTSAGGKDVFVLKLDPAGSFLSVRRFGGTGDDLAGGLALDATGNVYTAGGYQGTASFDTGSQAVSLTSGAPSGNNGLFLCKTTQDMGAIFGQVFNDLNNNGAFDPGSGNPETPLPNVTVYLDTNNNGVLDAGEPTAVTDAIGTFQFNHLAAGSYTVRQVLASGWTQSAPAGNAGATVNLAAGVFVDTLLLGAHAPNSTRHYANNTAVSTNKGKPNAVSTLNVTDAYSIFDLRLTLNVSNTKNTPLTVKLKGPDGTSVTLVANTAINGTVTFETPAFNYKGVKGTWTLEVDGLAGGTLNSWSLDMLGSVS